MNQASVELEIRELIRGTIHKEHYTKVVAYIKENGIDEYVLDCAKSCEEFDDFKELLLQFYPLENEERNTVELFSNVSKENFLKFRSGIPILERTIDHHTQEEEEEEEVDHVQELVDLFPTLSIDTLRKGLSLNNSNLALSIDWLMENGLTMDQENEKQQQQIKTNQKQLIDSEIKARILKKYDELPEMKSNPTHSIGNSSSSALLLAKPLDSRSKIRYRDGKIVSNKGDKYILEPRKEEWNSGVVHSGRIITKGKRGKGFVSV